MDDAADGAGVAHCGVDITPAGDERRQVVVVGQTVDAGVVDQTIFAAQCELWLPGPGKAGSGEQLTVDGDPAPAHLADAIVGRTQVARVSQRLPGRTTVG